MGTSVNDIIRLTGRTELVTGLTEEATIDEVLSDLQYVLPKHYDNSRQTKYLRDYWRGGQNILDRVKTVREDIDNKVIVNLAWMATRQVTGYTFGKPIEFIHKKDEDSDEMEIVNNCFFLEDKPLVDTEIFTDMSIGGIGYRMTLPRKGFSEIDYAMGKSPFSLTRLDPQTTFVVYSAGVPKEMVYAGMYYTVDETDTKGQKKQFTVFTVYIGKREYRFKTEGINPTTIKSTDKVEDEHRSNLLGIPIIEYRNNTNLSGDWEMAVSIIDAINVVTSDSVNDVVQFVQSLLVFINAEIDSDKAAELKAEKMLSLISQQNLQADVKYISQQLDASGVHTLREQLESDFNNVVGIPDRKTRGGGGGDTGEAVKLRDGWGDLEILARSKEPYVTKGEKETLIFAISTLLTYNLVKDLKIYDIEIKFSRNKSDNLLNKTQSYSTLITTETIAPEDAMIVCDFTNDPKEVAAKGKQYWLDNPRSDDTVDTETEIVTEE